MKLSLLSYKAKGPQSGETILPDTKQQDTQKPKVDKQVMEQLIEMGFLKAKCIKALEMTGNNGSEIAMQWLFEHMDDPGKNIIINIIK